MFEIIKFNNDACTGDSKNGTCYTSAECDDKGGTKDGSCADGYGVCCTFDLNCGGQSTENNTYFSTSGSESSGSCSLSVCPGDNICQLRLDFNSFVISGPYTSTTTTDQYTKVLYGMPDNTGVEAMLTNSQCTTDSFSVTSPSGSSPPVICGTNTGEHMYVDATSSFCNTLSFGLGTTATTTRSWEIRISQFECDYNNLAPQGCTQYFFGADDGKIQSFNYNSGSGYNLANQKQNICFRREASKSKVCFSYVSAYTDFDVSLREGASATPSKLAVGLTASKAGCCGYGNDGKKGGYDCLLIPSAKTVNSGGIASKSAATKRPLATGAATVDDLEGAFCGMRGIAGSKSAKTTKGTTLKATICTKRTPFMVSFQTDSFEYAVEANKQVGTKGFQLAYILA
jgi:hypothetical protein